MEWLFELYAKIDFEFWAWVLGGYALLSEYIGVSPYFKNSSVIQYLIGPVAYMIKEIRLYINKYFVKKE